MGYMAAAVSSIWGKSGKCGKYNHFAQSCGASVTTVKINNRSQAGGGSNFTISNLNINNIR